MTTTQKGTHTPGPWKIQHEFDTEPIYIVADDSGECSVAVVENENCEIETALADARLIAAAPELLAALQEFVADLKSQDLTELRAEWYDLVVTYEHALAAIQKATGGDL